jgi:flagellar motility protein MotE (MotC chaperone)
MPRLPSPPRLLPLTLSALVLLFGVKVADLGRRLLSAPPSVRAEKGAVITVAEAASPESGGAGAPSAPTGAGGTADGGGGAASGGTAKPGPLPPPTLEELGITRGAPAENLPSPAEQKLLLSLQERKKALDARESLLAQREAALSAAEKRLEARIEELKSLEQRLKALEAAHQKSEESNWAGLVKLYEVMRPRDAAQIFDDLDMNVVLPVIGRMKEAKAAAILAAMQPEKARAITAALAAERNRANAGG